MRPVRPYVNEWKELVFLESEEHPRAAQVANGALTCLLLVATLVALYSAAHIALAA